MASTQQERIEVYNMYNNIKWHRKVDKMPDYQIHAIYMSQQKKKAAEKNKPKPETLF